MSNQPTPPSKPLQAPSHPLLPPPRRSRFERVRGWLRSRPGRIIVPIVAFILGIAFGIAVLLFIGLSGEGQLVIVSAGKGDIIIEADKAFLTNLVAKNISEAGLPGTIRNVDVEPALGDQLTVGGDDTFSLLGFSITRHFNLVAQPYVSSCVMQIHVVHADLNGIPMTGFAPAFESEINRQLSQKPTGLPTGFQYCATDVRTEPAGLFVTYSATQISTDGVLVKRWRVYYALFLRNTLARSAA